MKDIRKKGRGKEEENKIKWGVVCVEEKKNGGEEEEEEKKTKKKNG